MGVLWFPFGVTLMVLHWALGFFFCVTIIGIPLGFQHLIVARYLFFPFTATVKPQVLLPRQLYSPPYYFHKMKRYIFVLVIVAVIMVVILATKV